MTTSTSPASTQGDAAPGARGVASEPPAAPRGAAACRQVPLGLAVLVAVLYPWHLGVSGYANTSSSPPAHAGAES